MRGLMCLATALILGCTGCSQRGTDRDLNSFLDEVHFVDKPSLKVISFTAEARGRHTLVFKTAKVDFTAMKAPELIRMPSDNHIGYIEKVTDYRFKAPAKEYQSASDVPVKKYGPMTFNFTKDGDDYIVDCMFDSLGGRPTAPAAPTTAK